MQSTVISQFFEHTKLITTHEIKKHKKEDEKMHFRWIWRSLELIRAIPMNKFASQWTRASTFQQKPCWYSFLVNMFNLNWTRNESSLCTKIDTRDAIWNWFFHLIWHDWIIITQTIEEKKQVIKTKVLAKVRIDRHRVCINKNPVSPAAFIKIK